MWPSTLHVTLIRFGLEERQTHNERVSLPSGLLRYSPPASGTDGAEASQVATLMIFFFMFGTMTTCIWLFKDFHNIGQLCIFSNKFPFAVLCFIVCDWVAKRSFLNRQLWRKAAYLKPWRRAQYSYRQGCNVWNHFFMVEIWFVLGRWSVWIQRLTSLYLSINLTYKTKTFLNNKIGLVLL